MSTAIETAVRMLESLPEPTRELVVEQLRSLVNEAEARERWDTLLADHPGPMVDGARAAIAARCEGRTEPLDPARMT